MSLKFVITGTGRCGTVFMARLLSSLGISCGHESVFNTDTHMSIEEKLRRRQFRLSHCAQIDKLTGRGIKPWVKLKKLVADSSYLSAPYLADPLLEATKIVHLVRHPMKVISSFVNDGQLFQPREEVNWHVVPFENFIEHHLPEVKEERSPLEKVCRFYIGWNSLIEEKAKDRTCLIHRIEDQVSTDLLRFLGKPDAQEYFTGRVNSWRTGKPLIRIEEVPEPLRSELVEIGQRYRYQLTSKLL